MHPHPDIADEVPGAVLDEPPPESPPLVAGGNLNELTAILRRLDQLKQERSSRLVEADELGDQIARLNDAAIELMVATGVDRLTLDGRTASISSATYGSRLDDVEPEAYLAAFEEAGPEWAALVKPGVNGNTLRSFLADWEAEHGDLEKSLPESIKAVLKLSTKFIVGFTKAAASKASTRRRAAARGG